jgi:hypothetical protein
VFTIFTSLFSFYGATAPSGPGPPCCRGFTITLRHTTLGRTPLDERSARRRDLYLTTHNTHKRQKAMPPPSLRSPHQNLLCTSLFPIRANAPPISFFSLKHAKCITELPTEDGDGRLSLRNLAQWLTHLLRDVQELPSIIWRSGYRTFLGAHRNCRL